MKLNADAFFAIGKTHQVCQDYARAGHQDGIFFAVACDGCSSSPDTDFGARLLAASAVSEIPRALDELRLFDDLRVIERADWSRKAVNLKRECLNATLILLMSDSHGVRPKCFGDGVVVGRRRDGSFVAHLLEYPNNAPFYLSYMLDKEWLRVWADNTDGVYVHRVYDSRRGTWETIDYFKGPGRTRWVIPQYFSAEEYDLALALSDGAQSFQRSVLTETSKTLEPVPVEEVVAQIVAIKGTAGQFLSRRCHKFLTRYCVQNGWQHADDFSAAGIWMGNST